MTRSLNDSISVRPAEVSRIIRHGRTSTDFAHCCNCKYDRFGVVILKYMLLANIGCRKDREKGSGRGSLLHIRAPVCLFELDQAHHAGDLKPEFTSRFDGLN